MWKVLLLIFVQFCAISFLVAANETISSRSDNEYRHSTHVPEEEQSFSEEYIEDEEYDGEEVDAKSGKPIGHWWNNGQALEPKWRDGDHVPQAPFQTVATTPNRKAIDDVEDVSTFQLRHKDSLPISEKSILHFSENLDNEFVTLGPRLSRRRKPPQLPEDELRELNEQGPKGKIEDTFLHEKTESPEGVVMKYRETFQNRPSEYELNDEEYQKPRPRKRRPPQNHEFTETKTSYPIYQTDRTPIVNKFQENSELKSLLKMQQGKDLSLSEILQRSNLTLLDLLQGKANVIDLLKTHSRESYLEEEEEEQVRDHISEKHMDNLLLTVKTVDKVESRPSKTFLIDESTSQKLPAVSEYSIEITTTVKNVDTDFPDVLQIEDNKKKTDPGTVDNLDEDEIMEFSDFTMKNGANDAEPTLSIEHILEPGTERTTIAQESLQKSESDNNAVLPNKSEQLDSLELEYQNDSPQDDEINFKEKMTEDKKVFRNHQNETSNYEDIVSRIEPEARAEIFELFSSGSSAKRLERLLKSRNMSIDELISLRLRGSSQVHLAEVSKHRRQKTFLVEPKNSVLKEKTNVNDILKKEAIEELKDNIADEQRFEMQENKVPFSQKIEDISEKPREILDIYTAFDSLPFAKNIKDEYKKIGDDLGIVKNGSMSFIEVGRVEQILNEESDSSNNMYEISRTNGEEVHKTLSKVRPSIIASGAILGVTLVVFLAIFIVCRIQQKQKYTYRNTFSRAVFQNPTMAARKLSNSSSLNTIMVNVVATSNTKRPEDCEVKSDIENDSLDGNDSWNTIPDFMK